MPRPLYFLALLWLFAVPLLAQEDEPELEGMGRRDPVAAAKAAARLALDTGRLEDAGHHLERALLHAPLDVDLVAGILETLEGEGDAVRDARLLWSSLWHELASGSDGRANPPSSVRRFLSDDPWPAALTKARASAVDELHRWVASHESSASKKPADRLLADWGRRLALDLARPVPRLDDAARADLAPLLQVGGREHSPVLSALDRLMKSALASGDTGLAMRSARALHGLAVQ
ncbi:MAG: hypothetical protein ABGY29_01265, partial [bacterium]